MKYQIVATTKSMSDVREGTLEAKLRIAAEKASAAANAAADKEAADKASKEMSLADRNANAAAEKAARKAARKAAIHERFAARKAANKQAEATRAAARANKQRKTALTTKKASPAEINALGERIVRLIKRREELNGLLGAAVEANAMAAYATLAQKRNTAIVNIKLLRNMLDKIASEYEGDAAMLTLINAAKKGKAYEESEEVEKTTRVPLLRYRVPVIKLDNIFDKRTLDELNSLNGLDEYGKPKAIAKKECSKEYHNRIVREARLSLAYLEAQYAKHIEFPICDINKLETRTMAQSQTSDIVGITQRGMQRHLAIIDHDLWERFNVLDADKIFPCVYDEESGEELTGSQRIERLVKGYIKRFETEGFRINFGNEIVHFESWCYSNSGLKKGRGMLMNSMTKRIHHEALYLGLKELPDTNGQEQYKIAALFNTPSALWERKWFDENHKEHKQRIHMRDVIMMKAIKIKIPLPKGAIIVGDGTDVEITVHTVNGPRTVILPITVDPDGTISITIDGWDGLALVNIKGFQPCQGRWAGNLKMLCVGVYGLLEKLIEQKPEYAALAGKPIYIEGIDGKKHLWREGSVLTTVTTWKAKKWFQNDWPKHVMNCERIATMYDGFDCLRVVSNADALDEMEKDRHTSRQLLSQLIHMRASDAHLLLEGSGKKVAKMATVSGALHKLAGLGKAEETITQDEYLFRAKPWLVGQNKIKTAMMVKMYDKLATLAVGEIDTCETTLFMAQDIAAMMEVALLGANVNNPNLGLLKAGEFSTPGMRDGKKSVLVRYPSNGLNGAVMVNRKIDAFETCGNIIMLNIHDPWIIDNDGDCDGDHAAAYENQWLVRMFEEMHDIAEKLGLNKTIIFEHGEGVQSKPATKEWLTEGRVEAVFNGMAFNYVGRFSNSALFAWTKCSDAYHRGDKESAYQWGMLANLFQVGAILTIDWCKTGVPKQGTPSRRIFEVALDLLDLQGDPKANGHSYAYKPWAQMFRDHEPGCCFVTKSKPVARMDYMGNQFMKHNYAKPSDAAIDIIAKATMEEAGMAVDETGVITKARFEATPEFDVVKELYIEPAVIEINGHLVAAKKAQDGIVRSKLLHQINPNRFNPNTLQGVEDKKIALSIQNNEPVSVLRFAQFCFGMLSELERGFAAEAKNSATEFSSAATHDIVYKATRSMLYSMIDDTPWSYKPGIIDPATGSTKGNGQLIMDDITDRDRKWQIIVDTIVRDAFEIGGNNRFNDKENPENSARVRARYAMFVLKVFAPDLLDRIERNEHVSEDLAKADLSFITVAEIEARRDDEMTLDGTVFVSEEYEDLYA